MKVCMQLMCTVVGRKMINIKKSLYNRLVFEIKYHLNPVNLVVNNISDQHEGHVGDDGSGESHFEIFIVSEAFEGKSRLDRHRIVYGILSNKEFKAIHAISITALSVSEYNDSLNDK